MGRLNQSNILIITDFAEKDKSFYSIGRSITQNESMMFIDGTPPYPVSSIASPTVYGSDRLVGLRRSSAIYFNLKRPPAPHRR